MYKTIQLSEKILDKNENKYRKSLKKISDEFEKYLKSKRLYKDDPIKNMSIIKKNIDNLEEINDKLLKLITDLKKEIEENNNKKRGIIGNIVYQTGKIVLNLFSITVLKNPNALINALSIGIEVVNITFSGVELKYTNVIIDELIKILREAKDKKKEVENEINSLEEDYKKVKKIYPKYY